MSLIPNLTMYFKLNIDNFSSNIKRVKEEVEETKSKFNFKNIGDGFDNFSKKLKDMQEDIKSTQEKLSGFKDIGDSISNVGKSLTLGITTPIIGATTAGVTFATTLEEKMAQISTIADDTGVTIDDLRKAIIQLSNDSGQSTDIIADGLYDALSSGVSTTEVIEFLTVAVKDAKGGFTDTATAVDGLTSTLNAYGKETSEALNLSNQMMIAQNLGKTTFGELASVIGNVAPTSNALKVSTEELFSSLAVLTANGIQTSQATSGLKAAFSNIIKPTKEAADASQALGLEFNAAAVGSKGWLGFLQDVKEKLSQMAPEYVEAVQKQSDLTLSLEALAESGKKSSDEYKKLKNELKETKGKVELLESGSNSVISAFGTMFGSVEGLNSILTLTSEQGISLYNESMEQMASGTDYVTEAYKKMNNTTSSNLAKTKEQFKNTLGELGETLLPTFNSILENIRDMMTAFNKLSPSAKNTIMVLAGMAATVGPVILVFGKLMSSITSIGAGFTTLKNGYKLIKGLKVVSGITKVISAFGKLKSAMSLTSIIGFITSPIGIAIGAFSLLVGAVVLVCKNWDAIKTKSSQVFSSAGKTIGNFCEGAKGFFNDLGDSISSGLKKAGNFIESSFNNASAVVSNSLKNIKDSAVNNYENIKKNTRETFSNMKTTVSNSFNEMKKNTVQKLGEFRQSFMNGISFIKNLPGQALEWGRDMISGFASGIKSSISRVLEPIRGVASSIRALLHFSRPDEGPLRDYETWMPDFMEGLGLGIENNKNKVLNPIKSLAENMNLSNKLVLKPTLEPSFASGVSSYSNSIQYSNSGPMLKVENLYVRNEQDIDKISRGIYNTNMNVIRGLGKRG